MIIKRVFPIRLVSKAPAKYNHSAIEIRIYCNLVMDPVSPTEHITYHIFVNVDNVEVYDNKVCIRRAKLAMSRRESMCTSSTGVRTTRRLWR